MTTENKHPKSSAKDVFSYLLMIIMLYLGVIFFITLLWQYINIQIPDPAEFYYTGVTSLIRQAISTLLIGWPVFILMSWLIQKDIRREHNKRDIWVRKWLMYLTLFVASLTIIIDLISITNSFLGGELTSRFALKVLVILVVAAAVFGYYLWDLRRDPVEKTNLPRNAAIASAVVILIGIIAGFFVVGSPAKQRSVRMDEQRISDLSSIQSMVVNHWVQKGELPESLDDLKDPLYGYEAPIDPITGTPYKYTATGVLDFTLCGTFAEDSVSNTNRFVEYPVEPVGLARIKEPSKSLWNHGAGEVCFDRSIDEELYRQEEPIPIKAPIPVR